ncbi:MAG: glycosyltransferase [Lachnospiraceae bacterium]|nr:glycosyltransferase [Lachnospiraceae bacterium]
MKIVQINTVFGSGSTGKIALSLYNSIKKNGDDPYVAYGRKTAGSEALSSESAGGSAPSGRSQTGPSVVDPAYLIGSRADFYGHVLVNFFAGKSGFGSSANTRKLIRWLEQIRPDIIHLHNLHGFYVNVEILFDYIKKTDIPVVWTLHDCWSFTGQCAHFDYAGCDKWKNHCHDCPIYRTNYPYSLFKDNSSWNYEHKKAAFTGVKNLTIVTPSKWLSEQVKQSFLKEYPVKIIYNGIDTEVFKPGYSVSDLDITPEIKGRKIITSVANVWDKQKGLSFILDLASMLKDDPSYLFVIIGLSPAQCREIKKKHQNNVLPLTRTSGQKELAAWYSLSYAYVNPTLEEVFGLTNVEALSCGTPVITFNTGGSPESVTPECGIVVPKGDVNALKKALSDVSGLDREACRLRALEFTNGLSDSKYLELYNKLSSLS